MPIDLIIVEEVNGSLFKATGTFSNKETAHSAEVFVQFKSGELSLISNPANKSFVANSEIEFLSAHEPVILDSPIIGTKLNFRNVHVTLKQPEKWN